VINFLRLITKNNQRNKGGFNMKKLVALSLAALLSVSLLAGCGGAKSQPSPSPTASPAQQAQQGGLKDGEYKAEAPEFDDKGYKATATVTVKDGKIADVKFDAVTEDGKSKKELSKSGEYGMKEKGGAIAEWHEQIEKLEKAIVEKGGVEDIKVKDDGKTDTVSGVTITVGEYVELFEKAIEKAK